MIRDARYCPECGCYIPTSFEECPACGHSMIIKEDIPRRSNIHFLSGNDYATQSGYETLKEIAEYVSGNSANLISDYADAYASMGGNAAAMAYQAGANSMRMNYIMATQSEMSSIVPEENAVYYTRDTNRVYASVNNELLLVSTSPLPTKLQR